MKRLLILAALAALAGCAVAPAPMYYTPVAQNYDPHEWHTVPADQPAMAGAAPQQYAPQQYVAQPVYTTEPVYAPVYAAPVYVGGPVYQPYYYPPVSIGLDFAIGGWCCHRGGWGRGGYRHR
jgi:hypothetical protein